MAIQALVAGRIIYLLSISQLGSALTAKISGKAERIGEAPAIVFGITCTIILQVIFSQWSLMNELFSTAPLNINQWFICLLVSLPMIVVVTLVNRFDPLN